MSFNRIKIARAGTESLYLIAKLGELTFRETFAESNTPEDLDKYIKKNFNGNRILQEMKTPGSHFFQVLKGREPAGYMKLNTGTAQKEKFSTASLEIERIYILKKFQGSGIGKTLIKKALDLAAEQEIKFIWLGVWEHNYPAIDFYYKLGFKKFGNHEFILGNDHQNDILLGLELP